MSLHIIWGDNTNNSINKVMLYGEVHQTRLVFQ